MSEIQTYTLRSFNPAQKFLVYDPSNGTTSLVLGSSLVNYIAPNLSYVFTDTTRASAVTKDYQIGQLIQTAGGSTIGDGGNGMYLVVAAGDGDYAMINGNELLLLPFGTLAGSDLDGATVTDAGETVNIEAAIARRDIGFDSIVALYSSNTTAEYVHTRAYADGGTVGGCQFVQTATGQTPTTAGTLLTHLAAGYVVNAAGVKYSIRTDQELTPFTFGFPSDNSTDGTANLEAMVSFYSAVFGGGIIPFVGGYTYNFGEIVFPTKVALFGPRSAILRCNSSPTATNWMSWKVTSGKGSGGGINGLTVDGAEKCNWGVFVDSWADIKFHNCVGLGFNYGWFDCTSNQSANSEFGDWYKCNLGYVVDGVTRARTPRFFRGKAGSTGNLTEYRIHKCYHIGITNGGTLGINATTGAASDTAGIGVEFDNCNRCIVDEFMVGNNQAGDTGSFDCAVYIHNSGSSGNTYTGDNLIREIYCEQAGSSPTIDAAGVIVNADETAGTKILLRPTIEGVRMSRGDVAFVDFRNNSSTANRLLYPKFINHYETLNNVANIVIGSNVLEAEIHATWPSTATVGITDNGTNTRLVPEYEVKSGTGTFVSGAATIDFSAIGLPDYRDANYEVVAMVITANETCRRNTIFADRFSIYSSNASSTADFYWIAQRKVLQ